VAAGAGARRAVTPPDEEAVGPEIGEMIDVGGIGTN
jgi:hypothetical protein